MRTWTSREFQAGPFVVSKWIPNNPHPTAELQALRPKAEKKRRGGGRKSVNYVH